MEFFRVLSLVRLSLLAFFIIFVFLIYEIFSLRKEGKRKIAPKLPHLDLTRAATPLSSEKIVLSEEQKVPIKKQSKTILIITTFFLVVFGVLSLVGYTYESGSEKGKTSIIPTSVPLIVSSRGIKIYNTNWYELRTDEEIRVLPAGAKLYIGIETIKQANIDMARVKVNEVQWKEEQITNLFNPNKNVFYKEHTIATDQSSLTIQAQLHSKEEGWLYEKN